MELVYHGNLLCVHPPWAGKVVSCLPQTGDSGEFAVTMVICMDTSVVGTRDKYSGAHSSGTYRPREKHQT